MFQSVRPPNIRPRLHRRDRPGRCTVTTIRAAPLLLRTTGADRDAADRRRRRPTRVEDVDHFVDGPVQLLEQSGMVQIEALLAWPRSKYGDLA
jgi:hypothetical protein